MKSKIAAIIVSFLNIFLAYLYGGYEIALLVAVYCILIAPLVVFREWFDSARINTFVLLKILPQRFFEKFNEIRGWILLPLPVIVLLLFLLIKRWYA